MIANFRWIRPRRVPRRHARAKTIGSPEKVAIPPCGRRGPLPRWLRHLRHWVLGGWDGLRPGADQAGCLVSRVAICPET
jgi:hypothetical protein